MEFSLKPDYEESKKRYEAFWNREIIDRPPVSITFQAKHTVPIPYKEYKNQRERWLDIEFRAEAKAIALSNHVFYGDALPIAWPNLGPEIFSAWCGCGYQFGENTAWSEPCINDWKADGDKAVFNPEHPLFKTTIEFTNLLLKYGQGHFIVGLTDFHPGGDHLAALRDPQQLAMDLIEYPEAVKTKLETSQTEFFEVYDIFYNILRSNGMPITSWTPLICDGRYYIPSNDFSCMISEQMFEEFFIPGITNECKFYERSIYHLDGPDALRHLDMLLDIPELDAIQWVCGAGNEGYARWVNVYQKIQKARKGIQLSINLNELPLVLETLRPEGIWFSNIQGIDSKETADKVIELIAEWK
ncbi:MAG TPA: hypothetical protein DIW17_06460 [Clostridiales bacterium]|nr:hypothetical protein [Clostridiales bacterium]